MLHEKHTRITNASRETLIKFIKDLFKSDPYKKDTGNKPVDVISISENEPQSVYIRVSKLGSRKPWCMSDGTVRFFEHELTFLLDVRVPETEQQSPDREGPNINIKNYQTNTVKKLSDQGEIADNVCDSIIEVFSLSDWRVKLSDIGIHNALLEDERETYQGTEYQNPMRLTFNAYVEI